MINRSRRTKTVIAVLAAVFIYSISIINVIIPKKSFSETENRVLQQKPEVSFKNIERGKFTKEFEAYISDQFMQRDFWVGMKSDADRLLGSRENNGVYAGREGYLLQKLTKPTDEDIEGRINAVNSFAQKNKDLNIYFALAPNSAEIKKDKLPYAAPSTDQKGYIERINKGLSSDINIVDLYTPLYNNRDEDIYYRTDHHWTTLGAYCAYGQISKSMGYKPRPLGDYNREKVTEEFYGSLYSKGGFRHIKPDGVELYVPKEKQSVSVYYSDKKKASDSLYNMDNLKKKDKYTVFLDGNHPLITIDTGNKGENLLVIKDSYANSVIPFLTQDFGSIYVVDLRYNNDSMQKLIEENKIKNVLILYNGNTFIEDASSEHIDW